MQPIRTGLDGLMTDVESQVGSLLADAFPDMAADGYDYGPQSPAAIILLLDGEEAAIGHLALYERDVTLGSEALRIGLIGGVAVARPHRGRGCARMLLSDAHALLRARGIAFSILFASEPEVYRSSGYRDMSNVTRFVDHDESHREFVYRGGMVAELAERPWPDGVLDLRGATV